MISCLLQDVIYWSETLPNIFSGNISPEKQDDNEATLLVTYYVEDEKDWLGAVQQEK